MLTINEQAIVEAATWLQTPYHHQMSVKGVGCDCLGLVRGIWRALYGTEPELPPAYSADWGEVSGQETLYDAAARNLDEIAVEDAAPGDVVLFRMILTAPAKHAGVLLDGGRFIHAYSGRAVTSSALSPWWQARLAAAFAWPLITPGNS